MTMCSIFSAMDQTAGAGLNLHCASDNPVKAPRMRLRVCSMCKWACSSSDEVSVCGMATAAAVELLACMILLLWSQDWTHAQGCVHLHDVRLRRNRQSR